MRTLATDDIGKSYRSRRVVNGVSLRVGQGEVVGLLGPNGAGKTTTFYAIVGLIPPDTGRVLIDEEDITDLPMYLRARQYGISYLPQEASVFRKLTVEENILAVLEVQPISWPYMTLRDSGGSHTLFWISVALAIFGIWRQWRTARISFASSTARTAPVWRR